MRFPGSYETLLWALIGAIVGFAVGRIMSFPAHYESGVWTLSGVILGFAISQIQRLVSDRREHGRRVAEATERIKRTMYLRTSEEAIQRIADLMPQFGDQEKIAILREVGMESSLNAQSDRVTEFVIQELGWMCSLYEIHAEYDVVKKSREDCKKVMSIQSALWEIARNIVEYRRSEELLGSLFAVCETLDTYCIGQLYGDAIRLSFALYKDVGCLSVGIVYEESPVPSPTFQSGVRQSVDRLESLKCLLLRSSFRSCQLSKLVGACGNAISAVHGEKERLASVSES